MATDDNRKRHLTTAKKAAIFGALLAIACQFLPHDYQAPCRILSKICTGGI